jgi:glycosyltransferase involved in cell wall biosynthesis
MVAAAGDLPVVVQLVGDPEHWQPRATDPRWRTALIRAWGRAYRFMERRACRDLVVLANNEELAAKLRTRVSNVEVVFTSSLPRSEIASEPKTFQTAMGTSRPVRLLYAGRFVREKGLYEAVDAIALLRERGIDATFQLVGMDDPGDPTIDDLLAYAAARGLAGAVEHLGYRAAGPELAEVYRSADIFLSPSYWEGFPHTIFEATGAGLPVVTTAVGGVGAWLHDDVEAVLIEPRSPQAICDAVVRLLSDGALFDRVARTGWVWAADHTEERSCELVAERVVSEHARAAASRPV